MAKAPTTKCGEIDFIIKTHRPDPDFQKVIMDSIGKAMTEKMNPFEIKFQLLNSDIWETTYRHYNDEVKAIKAALFYSENSPKYIVGVFSGIFITKIRNGEPIQIYQGHEQEVLDALGTDAQITSDMINPAYEKQKDLQNQSMVMDIKFEQNPTNKVYIGSCPDCKDGFYYPFIGPKEPCRTCNG